MARSLAALALAVSCAGCVRTAECDASVPCEDAEVCYDYVCRPRCEGLDDNCGGQGLCVPCQQDDAEGTIDHCFEATVFACIPESE